MKEQKENEELLKLVNDDVFNNKDGYLIYEDLEQEICATWGFATELKKHFNITDDISVVRFNDNEGLFDDAEGDYRVVMYDKDEVFITRGFKETKERDLLYVRFCTMLNEIKHLKAVGLNLTLLNIIKD